jgi:hypothetical protein
MIEVEKRRYVIVCEECGKRSKQFISYTYALEYCVRENGWMLECKNTICLECYRNLEE